MKNPWHTFHRYYLRFNRSDRNAIIILSTAIFLMLIGNMVLPHLFPKDHEDFSDIKAVFEAWENEQIKIDKTSRLYLFDFDPNTIADSLLNNLDLPYFVKQNLVRYREAGGKYTSTDDIRKVYGMTDSIFQVIQPYIQIENRRITKTQNRSSGVIGLNHMYGDSVKQDKIEHNLVSKVEKVKLELNSVDSTDLLRLPGIGPVFSKRIIKYRDLLGGFVQKEQLLEVYNFPEETYNNISDLLIVDSTLVRKLRINFLDFADLLKHPYLNKEQVTGIINRREKDGPFKNVSELASIQGFDSESFARISLYLTCE